MLYKIKTKSEVDTIRNKLPEAVITEALRVADFLDIWYNSIDMDGGYILIAEDITDLNTVKNEYFDYSDTIY